MQKGLRASIYSRGFSDALSPIKEAQNVTIVDCGHEISEADSRAPAVRLVTREFRTGSYIHAEPLEGSGNYAFGGRFIYCSDSRFRELHPYPIPLHDRDMSKE